MGGAFLSLFCLGLWWVVFICQRSSRLSLQLSKSKNVCDGVGRDWPKVLLREKSIFDISELLLTQNLRNGSCAGWSQGHEPATDFFYTVHVPRCWFKSCRVCNSILKVSSIQSTKSEGYNMQQSEVEFATLVVSSRKCYLLDFSQCSVCVLYPVCICTCLQLQYTYSASVTVALVVFF